MKKLKKKIEQEKPIIVKDTREQQGYTFNGFEVVEKKLDTADYSILNYENIIVVERKRIGELYNNFTSDRERFMKEVERLKRIPHRFIVVEGNYEDLNNREKFTKIQSKVLIGTITSLILKHKIPVLFASNAKMAEIAILDCFTKFDKYIKRGDIL